MVGHPFPVSVTTTRQRIVPFAQARTSVALVNLGTGTIYIGTDEELNTTNGFPVAAGQGIVFARDFGDDPGLARLAVCASGTQDVRISEEYGRDVTALVAELVDVMRGR